MRAFTDRDIPIHCEVARARALRSLETLATIKNPHPVAFVRQANIAATTGPA